VRRVMFRGVWVQRREGAMGNQSPCPCWHALRLIALPGVWCGHPTCPVLRATPNKTQRHPPGGCCAVCAPPSSSGEGICFHTPASPKQGTVRHAQTTRPQRPSRCTAAAATGLREAMAGNTSG